MFKQIFMVILSILLMLAGVNHFLKPDFYAKMISFLPAPRFLVYLSGVCEVVLGAMLLIPGWSRLAAWGIIALMVAVFPANVYMALHPEQFPRFSATLLWIRLPLQIVLIAWAYWFTMGSSSQ